MKRLPLPLSLPSSSSLFNVERLVITPCECIILIVAFTLVDIDGDGQVSKHDLVRYLELITAAPEGVKVDLVRQVIQQLGAD